MRWTVGSAHTLYQDQWVHLQTATVDVPDGPRFDHRIVRTANGAYALVVHDGRVLLLWRHRFICDTWGWEVPGGAIERGERSDRAAARELLEETGWRPAGALEPLVDFFPMGGLISAHHHVFVGHGAVHVGAPTDRFESERVVWVPLADVRRIIGAGEIVDGTTLLALLALLERVG
ncbi:NUDIX hydrolase [Dactylosporangium sp. NPDC049525]|uniref:NUDIX hydrolase n=1 Tax=Dactylosporangium sp. NPDC049525 TaxID=3154730 RepID=UPI003420DEC7